MIVDIHKGSVLQGVILLSLLSTFVLIHLHQIHSNSIRQASNVQQRRIRRCDCPPSPAIAFPNLSTYLFPIRPRGLQHQHQHQHSISTSIDVVIPAHTPLPLPLPSPLERNQAPLPYLTFAYLVFSLHDKDRVQPDRSAHWST